MTIPKNLIIAVLVIVIMLFMLFNIWEKHPSVVDSHMKKVDSLENQIAIWDSLAKQHMLTIDSLQSGISNLKIQNDSIAKSKVRIKHIYHEIYNDINSASNSKLDSIIRSNW